MDTGYSVDNSGNYIIFPRREGKSSYIEKMIQNGAPSCLLELSVRNMNGESCYYYDIKGGQTFSNRGGIHKLSYSEIDCIFAGIMEVFEELKQFLLPESGLCLMPECIVIMGREEKPYFCFHPQNGECLNESAFLLAEYLMRQVDHEDERAKKLAYGYYGLVSEGVFNPKELYNEEIYDAGETEKGYEEEGALNDEEMDILEEFDVKDAAKSEENSAVLKNAWMNVGVSVAIIFLTAAIYGVLFFSPIAKGVIKHDMLSCLGVGVLLLSIATVLIALVFRNGRSLRSS